MKQAPESPFQPPASQRAACYALSLWVLSAAASAQTLQPAGATVPARDPTLPPASLQAPARSISADPGREPETAPHHLMVVDGKRYVVERGRRLGVGDLLNQARIERIDDGAVWLREGGTLRQVSLYGGITKRMVPDKQEDRSTATAAPAPARAPRHNRIALSPAPQTNPNR